jgi:hypothetical protein
MLSSRVIAPFAFFNTGGTPTAATEEVVRYDLLIGADGADSLVRERMVQAKVSLVRVHLRIKNDKGKCVSASSLVRERMVQAKVSSGKDPFAHQV